MCTTFDVNFHCIVNGPVTAEGEALYDLPAKRFHFEVVALEVMVPGCCQPGWMDLGSIRRSGGGGLLGACKSRSGDSREPSNSQPLISGPLSSENVGHEM